MLTFSRDQPNPMIIFLDLPEVQIAGRKLVGRVLIGLLVLGVLPFGIEQTDLTGLDAQYGRRKRGDGQGQDLTSASLYDVARIVYEVEASELKHPLTFYIPKSESAAEAEWWSELFKALAALKGWEPDYIRCFALVESHPLAFEIEEFLYELRDHLAGLNCGRWDYIFSCIKKCRNRQDFLLPDRAQVTMTTRFMRSGSLLWRTRPKSHVNAAS